MTNKEENKNYYGQSAIEPIVLMVNVLTPDEFEGFVKGNMIKYSLRAPYKGQNEEDRKKAVWYKDLLDFLNENFSDMTYPEMVYEYLMKKR